MLCNFDIAFRETKREEALLLTNIISSDPIKLFISTDKYSFLFPLANVVRSYSIFVYVPG